MEYKNKNIFNINMNYKTIPLLILVAILPNLLGMINMPTVFGFKIHTFQFVVFMSAALYGPIGGAISGGMGSFYTAFALNNPYIIVGNIILGFAAGYFFRKGFGIVKATMIAFAIQAPWLYLSDVYLAGMPHALVINIIIALVISNLFWSISVKYTQKYVNNIVK